MWTLQQWKLFDTHRIAIPCHSNIGKHIWDDSQPNSKLPRSAMAASSPRSVWIYARATRKDGACSESGGGWSIREAPSRAKGLWIMRNAGVFLTWGDNSQAPAPLKDLSLYDTQNGLGPDLKVVCLAFRALEIWLCSCDMLWCFFGSFCLSRINVAAPVPSSCCRLSTENWIGKRLGFAGIVRWADCWKNQPFTAMIYDPFLLSQQWNHPQEATKMLSLWSKVSWIIGCEFSNGEPSVFSLTTQWYQIFSRSSVDLH